jgi:hypothetical protein
MRQIFTAVKGYKAARRQWLMSVILATWCYWQMEFLEDLGSWVPVWKNPSRTCGWGEVE